MGDTRGHKTLKLRKAGTRDGSAPQCLIPPHPKPQKTAETASDPNPKQLNPETAMPKRETLQPAALILTSEVRESTTEVGSPAMPHLRLPQDSLHSLGV